MERDEELLVTCRRFYQAVTASDVDGVHAILTQQPGVLFIGTDPAEWWADGAALRRKLAAQLKEMGGFQLVEQELSAYREGSVGWVADRPLLRLPDGSELPLRFTGVYHREEGGWKLVQSHLSIGVKNEEAVGKELTI